MPATVRARASSLPVHIDLVKVGMTISRRDRIANGSEALSRMFELLGDHAYDQLTFDGSDSVFAGIYPTTFKELVDGGYISTWQIGTSDLYRLTGSGWAAAAKSRGLFDSPEFQKKIGILCAALKSHVQGRKDPFVIPIGEIASETGLDWNWVVNVIEGKVLEEHFNRRGASWIEGGVGGVARHLRIPIDFGLPRD